MKTSGKIRSICFLAGLLLARSGNAQEALRLSLEADKKEFARGEPVVVFAALKNTSSQAVETEALLTPDYGYVTYLIEEQGRSEEAFLPWALREPGDTPGTLAPGEEIKRAAKLFYGGNGWTFQRPGLYKVRAVYLGRISSNTLEITISVPQDKLADQAANLFLDSDEVGRFLLFEGGDHLKEGMRRVEQVAKEMPTSPHAAYANISLAASLGRDFADFTAGRLRPADPRQAIDMAERAQSGSTSFYYIVRQNLILADAYEKTGEGARAATLRNRLSELAAARYPSLVPFLRAEMQARQHTPKPSEH